jgi:hypothetical protein
MTESVFLTTYGSPLLQASLGLGSPRDAAPSEAGRDLAREAAAAEMRSGLEEKFDRGGVEEAVIRALIYIRRPDGAFDERGYRMLKAIRATRKANERLTIPEFREMFNVQLQLVLIDEERAVAALPKLLQSDGDGAAAAHEAFTRLAGAAGSLSEEGQRRLDRVERLFAANASNGKPRGSRAAT